MPGLAGCFTSIGRAPVPEPDTPLPLVHEPFYQRTAIAAQPHGWMEVVHNATHPELAGAASHDGITAAYYGEFYNPELAAASGGARTAEILIALYRKHGERLPEHLDGSFVACIFDGATALLFNDHCASRQTFYSFQNGTLYFAPELKGVVHHREVDRSIDEGAFVSFFVNGALSGGRSFYRSVFSLRPGSLVKIRNGDCTESEYFQYRPDGRGRDLGEEHYVEALSEALREAVRRRTRHLGTTAVPLSGGIDSRGILGCVHLLAGGRKLTTVSWGKDEDTAGSDAFVARRVAEFLGTEHHFLPRTSVDFEANFEELFYRLDGLTDDAWMHHSELRAVRNIRCQLGMAGIWRGEECFGHWPEPVSEAAARINSGYHVFPDHPEWQRIFNAPARARFLKAAKADLRDFIDRCPVQDLTDRRDYWYYYERLFHYHTRGSYFKMTVLEVESPWLDKRLLRLLESLPVRYRVERMLYKKALGRLFPDLMAMPPATATSLEDWPEVVRNDPKIQAYLRHHLVDSRNRLHEWLDADAVRGLLAEAFTAPGRSRKTGILGTAKNTLRRTSPALFNLTKSLAGSRVMRFYPTPAAYIAMRLLCAKRWFDRFG
jgi:asparagine synthetase B (glutamine-hydrolysing)